MASHPDQRRCVAGRRTAPSSTLDPRRSVTVIVNVRLPTSPYSDHLDRPVSHKILTEREQRQYDERRPGGQGTKQGPGPAMGDHLGVQVPAWQRALDLGNVAGTQVGGAKRRSTGRNAGPVPCARADRSIGQVAKDFDLTETAVRDWVRQADIDAGHRSDGLTSAEREELAASRRENRRLREDVEILKRATAFFVKETR